jgi:hypothetical protein
MKINFDEVVSKINNNETVKVHKDSLYYDMGILKDFDGSSDTIEDYSKKYLENLVKEPIKLDFSEQNFIKITKLK